MNPEENEEIPPSVCPECHAVDEPCAPWCQDLSGYEPEDVDGDGHPYDCTCAWCGDEEYEP